MSPSVHLNYLDAMFKAFKGIQKVLTYSPIEASAVNLLVEDFRRGDVWYVALMASLRRMTATTQNWVYCEVGCFILQHFQSSIF